jgi:hypothetical protein
MARPISQPCGTRSAYKRHLKHLQEPCRECKNANNEWHKQNLTRLRATVK